MQNFSIAIDNTSGITTVVIVGAPTADEVLAFVKGPEFAKRTDRVIMDFCDLKLTNMPSSDFVEAIRNTKPLSREGAKIAFVCSTTTQVGMGNMFKSHAELIGFASELEVFRDKVEASSWVKGEFSF